MQQLNRYYRHSKISERKTRQIIKYFALDLTAGKTAQMVAMTRASVSHIFVKVRVRIAEECERASPFSGTVEVDESYFGARRVRGNAVAAHRAKQSSSVFSNAMVRSIPKLSRTAKLELCSRLFAAGSLPTPSFIRTAGAVMTLWLMSALISILESIIRRINLPMGRTTLTALKVSGLSPNVVCISSTAFRVRLFICTWKSANIVSIIASKTCSDYFWNYLKTIRSKSALLY